MAPTLPSLSEFASDLARTLGEGWTANVSGTVPPREAWVKRGTSSVGVFQEEDGLRIVVWIDRDCETTTLRSSAELDGFPAWLAPRVERQRAALDVAEAEARRRAALPLPDVDAVIAVLKAGRRITTSGARYHETFFWDGGLRCEIFDEGDVSVRDVTKKKLREAIAAFPDPFRAAGRSDDR